MMRQPSLFSRETPDPPPPEPNSAANTAPLTHSQGEQDSKPVPRWLQYMELCVRVVVRLYIGLILIFLPWTHFWSDNRLLLMVPHLAFIALNGVTRGLISGLGLLNIWISVHDAAHFKEH